MQTEYDHDEIVKDLGLIIERDKRFGLVKYWIPSGDQKTDLIGAFYPDVTCLRREGRQKIMIEVLTPYSFEDSDELRRLEGLSDFCAENKWEYYFYCPDEKVEEFTRKKIDGRNIRARQIWTPSSTPFQPEPINEFQA